MDLQRNFREIAGSGAKILTICLCTALTILMLLGMLSTGGSSAASVQEQTADVGIMDKFDMQIVNTASDALSGVLSIEKVYWLSDDDLIAPEPDPEKFGVANDPSELGWLLEAAEPLLAGQETIFSTETELYEGYYGTVVNYYLDNTIFAVNWKQPVGKTVLTISEVKIAHPSQFRRFLSGGEYGSRIRYKTSEMAASVNAVTASAGDYYAYRPFGVLVNNGVAYRVDDTKLDTCFVDKNGDLLFVPKGTLPDQESTERYIEEHDIRFSLSFGPIMIENGEVVVPANYAVGEINKDFSRAAICQLGECHYLLVTANKEPFYYKPPSLKEFAGYLLELGVTHAYALDGGQTATIVMHDELMNGVDYGGERDISDIIYFATAMPEA